MFCGLKGWTEGLEAVGFEVITLDIVPEFNATITGDILDVTTDHLRFYGPYDIIVASPPCQAFSVSRLSLHWNKTDSWPEPKTDKARLGIELVTRTLQIIDDLSPKMWLMENPRAMLRKAEVTSTRERRTVTYCQYGKPYMKPTDLWGNFEETGYEPKEPCRRGMPCHEAAPRGSHDSGVQGLKNAAERGKIPFDLSYEVGTYFAENLT